MKTWEEAMQAFGTWLADSHGEIEILGMSYSPARVLAEIDPTAYRCALLDFIDSEGLDSDEFTDDDNADPREPGFAWHWIN